MNLLLMISLILALLFALMPICLWVAGILHQPNKPLKLKVFHRVTHNEQLFTLYLRRYGFFCFLPLPRFRAGQSIGLSFLNHRISRRYSLARWERLPFVYEVSIRRELEGKLSNRLYQECHVGTILNITRPTGEFIYSEQRASINQPKKWILIAGGIGITPLLAMIERWSKSKNSTDQLILFWQVRHEDELIYKQQLSDFQYKHAQLKVYFLVSQSENKQLKKRISIELIREVEPEFSHFEYWMCASSVLLTSMQEQLHQNGVSLDAINFERFGVSGLNSESTPQDIFFKNQLIRFDGHRNLLDLFEEHEIEIRSDCRAGHCGLCKKRVVSGKVKYVFTPECNLSTHEVLTCCAVPLTQMEIE